jgi:hypothetical protein
MNHYFLPLNRNFMTNEKTDLRFLTENVVSLSESELLETVGGGGPPDTIPDNGNEISSSSTSRNTNNRGSMRRSWWRWVY